MKKFVIALMLCLTVLTSVGIEFYYPDVAYATKRKSSRRKKATKRTSRKRRSTRRSSAVYFCTRCGYVWSWIDKAILGNTPPAFGLSCPMGGKHTWSRRNF